MADPGPKQRRFFTTSEVARYCEVSTDGVLKWIKAGKLRAFATPGGHYRVSLEDFRAFLARYEFPVHDSLLEPQAAVEHATTLLIVDGDPARRGALREALSALEPGWRFEEAADGYEAGIKIGSLRPDAVVIDVPRAEAGGLSLCKSIRANPRTAAIAVLVVSGEAGASARSRAIRGGADGLLPRPADPERLRTSIGRALDRRRPRGVRPRAER